MRLTAKLSARIDRRIGETAFTMVEIAISIGVLAFAMVAIMGVMPTGLNVQRDNREDTVINQDGSYWLEAVRNGSIGLDELTNYVDSITISNGPNTWTTFTNKAGPTGITNGYRILVALSTPKYEPVPGTRGASRTNINSVTARVRAISGSAIEKNKDARDIAFSYLLSSEIVPYDLFPFDVTNLNEGGLRPDAKFGRTNAVHQAQTMAANFYQLRVTLQWPLFTRGNNVLVGNNRKSFTTLVGGQLTNTPPFWPPGKPTYSNYYFLPSTFVQLP